VNTNRARAGDVIAASGARQADQVTIAGTANLDIMIELVRRGFSRVLCRSADRGPHSAMPPADILIAPNLPSEGALCRVLTQLGRELRPAGSFVMSYAANYAAFNERRLRQTLLEGGFASVEKIAASDDAGTLWCARKAVASLRQAA
jgi:hypothetical protein